MHHSQLTNKEQFPILSHLAKVVFAVTAASLSVRACVLHSWKHRLAKESKPQSWEGWGVRHNKMRPEATQVDGPQELKGDFCSCSPVHLFLINKWRKMILSATVYWICHSNCWISHPRLCFIAFKMKSYYPVPSHFQFSGRDGSGTWKKVRDGSGTGIPSDPAYKYKEKQKEQILFSAKRWIGHFVSRSYQELVSFRAPSTLPLANIMSPALSVNFEKHCSQQSPPDFKLYLGELFSCFLSIWIFFIPINMAPGQIHLSICSKNECHTRIDRKGSFQ